MKYFKLLSAVIFFSVLITSCKKEKVTGSGSINSETRSVANFYSVSSFGSSEVFITQGNGYSVTVTGFENLIPHLKTYIQNGTLIVKYDDNVNVGNDNSEVHITMPSLISVSGQGSGDIKVTGQFIGMENFAASTSGSGDIEIENGSAQNLTLRISGSGDIESFGLATQNAIIHINGSGDAEVSVAKSLKATISGSGNIIYKGNPDVETSISGSGKVIKQ